MFFRKALALFGLASALAPLNPALDPAPSVDPAWGKPKPKRKPRAKQRYVGRSVSVLYSRPDQYEAVRNKGGWEIRRTVPKVRMSKKRRLQIRRAERCIEQHIAATAAA